MKIDIGNVDWELLGNQKATLIRFAWDKKVPTKCRDDFEGILNLIDTIQDEAAKQIGAGSVFKCCGRDNTGYESEPCSDDCPGEEE